MTYPGIGVSRLVSGPPVLVEPIADRQASGDATVDIAWTGDFAAVFIDFFNVRPATDTQNFQLQTSGDGGATFDAGATDYVYRETGFSSAQTTNAGPASSMRLSPGPVGNAAGEFVHGSYILLNPFDTGRKSQIIGQGGAINNAGQPASVLFWGQRDAAGRIDALRFAFAAGNVAEGRFTLAGLRKG